MNQEKIFVHSARMAGWIMFNGIMYDEIIKNKKYENKNVYIFHKDQRISGIMQKLPTK